MASTSPIFIGGAGRSDSTAFHHAFARHPHVSWISKILDVVPRAEKLNELVLRGLDTPLIGTAIRSGLIESGRLKPSEAYKYWEGVAPGFSEPFRDLVADDLTERSRANLTDAVERLVVPGRSTPLIKITGWPRIGYLQKAFPDARFIHIVRDGRAVVNSILQVDFWDGWRGTKGWRGLDMTPAQKKRWDSSGQSFVTLGAMELSDMLDAMGTATSLVPTERFLELRYEDLCEDPIGSFKTTAQFCDLEFTDSFARTIEDFGFRNTNDKWRRDLTEAQQQLLESELEPHLRHWGYPLAFGADDS
ncbi:MAG: sulfotransferase family protein [Acidimicrobiales bacterium]